MMLAATRVLAAVVVQGALVKAAITEAQGALVLVTITEPDPTLFMVKEATVVVMETALLQEAPETPTQAMAVTAAATQQGIAT